MEHVLIDPIFVELIISGLICVACLLLHCRQHFRCQCCAKRYKKPELMARLSTLGAGVSNKDTGADLPATTRPTLSPRRSSLFSKDTFIYPEDNIQCCLRPIDDEEFDFFPGAFLCYQFLMVLLCTLVFIQYWFIPPDSIDFDMFTARFALLSSWETRTQFITRTNQWDATEVLMVYGVLLLSAYEALFAFYRYISVRQTAISLQVISTRTIFKPYLRFAACYVVLYALQIHLYYYLFIPVVIGVAVALVFCTWQTSNTLIKQLSTMQRMMNSARCNQAQDDVVKTLIWQKKSSLLACTCSALYIALLLMAYDIGIVCWLPPLWCIINISYTLNFVRNRTCIKTQCLCCSGAATPKPKLCGLRSMSNQAESKKLPMKPIQPNLEAAAKAPDSLFKFPVPPSSPPDTATPNTQDTVATPQPLSVPPSAPTSPDVEVDADMGQMLCIAIDNLDALQEAAAPESDEGTFFDADGKEISIHDDDDDGKEEAKTGYRDRLDTQQSALPTIPGTPRTPELSVTMRVHPDISVNYGSRSPSHHEPQLPRGNSNRSDTGKTTITTSVWKYFRSLTDRQRTTSDADITNTGNAPFDKTHSVHDHQHLRPFPAAKTRKFSDTRSSPPTIKPTIGVRNSDPVVAGSKSGMKRAVSKHIVSASADVGPDAVRSMRPPANRNRRSPKSPTSEHNKSGGHSRTVTERRLVFDVLPPQLQELPESVKKTVEDLARLNKVMSMHGFIQNNALFKFEMREIELDDVEQI